jgi:predicted DNA-binding protein with PD1-like motif
MMAKLLNGQGEKVYALVCDTSDEVVGGLTGFAATNQLGGSHFTAIGAFQDVTLGFVGCSLANVGSWFRPAIHRKAAPARSPQDSFLP